MTNSKQIAGLIGPTAIALTASELNNLHIWTTNIPTLTYLNGSLLFVAGLAIIRVHNYWIRNWTVMVTLAGWIYLISGLYRMFAPEAPQLPQDTSSYIVIAVLLVIGLFLTFKAFSPEDHKTPSPRNLNINKPKEN
jgi:uncharacterized membrane protein YhaH (DUF805 family)